MKWVYFLQFKRKKEKGIKLAYKQIPNEIFNEKAVKGIQGFLMLPTLN